MKTTTQLLGIAFCFLMIGCSDVSDTFTTPERGFTSEIWVDNPLDFRNGILTGNGTMGAIVLGRPYDENIYLSHAGIYLPREKGDKVFEMASRMGEIQQMCLNGDLKGAGELVNTMRMEQEYTDWRDPYIGACILNIKKPEATPEKYQRSVDFMTAETAVQVSDENGSFTRTAFASRTDSIVVVRITGTGKQTAELSLKALEPHNDREMEMREKGIKSTEQQVKDGLLYMRTIFAHTNEHNPNIGFEGFARVVTKGGNETVTDSGISIENADEILVFLKVRPIVKNQDPQTNFDVVKEELESISDDYGTLLSAHASEHGELMDRVSFSLDAPEFDRGLTNEKLLGLARKEPLAMIERAFDAGRYNIICSTGLYPPNLVGLWSATWSANWEGSFTTNGNLPCAVSFNLMGNMPELMEPYFRFHDARWEGFRTNAKALFGTRGFNVPGQLTMSPLQTDFSYWNPHVYWHAGAAWTLLSYYDYYRYFGDEKFLREKTYPLMKEACEFYEDFLTIRDKNGKLVFVPTYSPENFANGEEATTVNATMEVGAAKQLLRNTIEAAKLLDVDAELQKKWATIIADLPDYQVDENGFFKEWLWPGQDNNLRHRHASLFYPLYDDAPMEITGDTVLVKSIEKYLQYHLPYKDRAGDMAFGVVQDGLTATHIGNGEYAQDAINLLLKGFWTNGMVSLHDKGRIMNMDISGGFPYLCSSTLVYADLGYIKLLPALPPQWKKGKIKGIRLRGGILVNELSWSESGVEATLTSDKTQSVVIEKDGEKMDKELKAGVPVTVKL